MDLMFFYFYYKHHAAATFHFLFCIIAISILLGHQQTFVIFDRFFLKIRNEVETRALIYQNFLQKRLTLKYIESFSC